MPELPEVEVTRQGISPHLIGAVVDKVIVRNPKLRWPIDPTISHLEGQTIRSVTRRAKYLLLDTEAGTLILHLGMSGSLRVLNPAPTAEKHDHLDIVLSSGAVLRLNDPRRFGAAIWWALPIEAQPLLKQLGPEPLTDDFNVEHLVQALKGKTRAIKLALMDNKIVVGVGNIYANEALFAAGINPKRACGSVSKARLTKLVEEVKLVLAKAIEQGGTTLKDFTNADGKPGYFVQQLHVYGRGGLPCDSCGSSLQEIKLGQRATVFCGKCQR
ncbi:bifunctional DNA-formamidopyrimidine glycosylase/DNA-(apurinic or apyrimidinic site) lyase [Ferrimonas lipolytica]|uniref:Formamidopyrimidine-DNA glycosylase n=1 Tax=Ferrimonas lipolytica TaxID=2724191 RepID=A0A6H1UGW7_9GAMM|nr:bifunctional DNA-formamidopyrimidine glycosylase/DNA-(apurinic or apyrimidinic site) lyase [Ferrimonas lipolytica]QIZ78347.1 bifunctional DNA-formamidopyrimidine glycosylase/DNA-(apurinic or apyrimidinic site) lyase [Ferrimonas lipolytica]